ncbi:MAG: hypothetical protein KME47_09645 [Nodosilinea sp. WJT8-NPBG4]|jgi:hypothetical protein|nr:hypothetical protein [Nodosilinea sp. WJT8-NPBG4]
MAGLNGGTIRQGDTVKLTHTLESGAVPHFNTPGYTTRFVVKSALTLPDEDAEITKRTGNGITVISNLVAETVLAPSDTSALQIAGNGKKYFYELQIAKNDGSEVYTREPLTGFASFIIEVDLIKTAVV